MIRAIDTNVDYMYLQSPKFFVISLSRAKKVKKRPSVFCLAKRPRTARCSASAGAYGDTLEHENYDEAYHVYNTARRHIQARR